MEKVKKGKAEGDGEYEGGENSQLTRKIEREWRDKQEKDNATVLCKIQEMGIGQ